MASSSSQSNDAAFPQWNPPAHELEWFRRRMKAWAAKNLRDFPWRQTKNPYAIFVAEFLLQQTDAPRVFPVYMQFLERYPTLDSLARASFADLTKLLAPLEFHLRAVKLRDAALIMTEEMWWPGPTIPDDEEKLLRLPGVGRYTARAICANAFGRPLAVLDTNVVRILQRFFGLDSRRARPRNDPRLWDAAQKAAPRADVGTWNLALIDFGAAVCTSRKPRCGGCPLRGRCDYFAGLQRGAQMDVPRSRIESGGFRITPDAEPRAAESKYAAAEEEVQRP